MVFVPTGGNRPEAFYIEQTPCYQGVILDNFIGNLCVLMNFFLVTQDPDLGVLLSWRDDPFGSGWHVPGSIIRHREEIAHRITACALDEFGCELQAAERPVALIQIFDDRGHSITLCFPAKLRGAPGDLRWFRVPPSNLYPSHRVYDALLGALARGELGTGIPGLYPARWPQGRGTDAWEGVIASDVSLA